MDATTPPAAPAAALVLVPGAARSLNKIQKRFNELSSKVRERRETLAGWTTLEDHVRSRSIAETDPLAMAMQQALRWQMLAGHRVLLADQQGGLVPPPLGKARRKKLLALLLADVDDWLDLHGADPEIEALGEHWAPGERARELAEELDATRELLASLYGQAAVRGIEASTADELEAKFAERMDEREAQRRERLQGKRQRRAQAKQATGAPGAAAPAAEDAHGRAEREATQSVKDVYRRLAGALHPDRETDPVEHERKLGLMKRVNQAYEARDLLALLTIQIEIEQVDADHLVAANDQRLRAYCDVLLEQLMFLERDIHALRGHLELYFGELPRGLPSRAWFDKLIDRQRDELKHDLEGLYDSTAALAEPALRNAAIDGMLRKRQAEFEAEHEDLDEPYDDPFADPFGDWMKKIVIVPPAARQGGGKKGRGRRR
jgi:hypothetical protein